MHVTFSSVFVSGGAGFIGSNIVDALLKQDVRVGIRDNFRTGGLDNLDPRQGFVKIHRGDVSDARLVFKTVPHYEAILHHAAEVGIAASDEDPLRIHSTNVNGTLNLMKSAADSGVEHFVFASSAAVYGRTEKLPTQEDAKL